MIEDYILPATPGAARRLAYLASVTGLELDEATRALASQGLITRRQFSALPANMKDERQEAVQTLIDMDLRGLLLCCGAYSGRMEARNCVLSAVRLTGAKPMIVVTRDHRTWEQLAEAWGFSITRDVHDEDAEIVAVEPHNVADQPLLSRRRGGVLVFDHIDYSECAPHEFSGPAREVARTIFMTDIESGILAGGGGWNRSCDAIVAAGLSRLYSSRASEIIGRISEQHKDTIGALRERGFSRLRPAALYPMFNVVTDLLGAFKPK